MHPDVYYEDTLKHPEKHEFCPIDISTVDQFFRLNAPDLLGIFREGEKVCFTVELNSNEEGEKLKVNSKN